MIFSKTTPVQKHALTRLVWICLLLIALPAGDWCQPASAGLPESAGEPAPATQGDEAELAAAQKEYDEALAELRRLTKEATRARVAFQAGTREESEAHRREWDAAVEAGERQRNVLEQAALRLLALRPKPPKELLELVNQIHGSYVLGGQISRAEKVAQALRGLMAEDEGFQSRDAIAAIYGNNFEAAEKFRASYGHLISEMPAELQGLFDSLPELKQK